MGISYSDNELLLLGGGDKKRGVEIITEELFSIGLNNLQLGDPRPLDEEISRLKEEK